MHAQPDGRLTNGVRARADGKGDDWANAHRDGLGTKFFMQDVDVMFGMVAFGQNTADRLFLEYAPDPWTRRASTMRRFGFISMFDRKSTIEAAFSDTNFLSSNVYRWQCRTLNLAQPEPGRFFFVIGGNNPPWQMIEVNLETGKALGEPVSCGAQDWPALWRNIGLTDLRHELSRWLAQ